MTQKPNPANDRIVLVTGPSGAGRSTAINALEDLGFESIDNMPLSLVPRLLEARPLDNPLALGIDIRNRDFSVPALLDMARDFAGDADGETALLYLDARADVLLRRFSETRRRHPFSGNDSPAVGVEQELALLAPLRERADVLIDTSDMSPHDLRRALTHWFSMEETGAPLISLHSFSYRRGLPQELDMAFDVRFLANPHWEADLRPLDGRDNRVSDYIQTDLRFQPFFQRVSELVLSLLPAYIDEGKAHLAIGFGCTGGKHRSVAMVEKIANTLAEAGWQVSIRHRELERRGK